MARIKGKDTQPEMQVRRLLHSMGYRFRLHRADLPGKPDVVLPRLHKAIFVNGCYWHMHECRYGQVIPKTNAAFWAAKRSETVARDKRKQEALERLGWEVLVVWECETQDLARLRSLLEAFLSRV